MGSLIGGNYGEVSGVHTGDTKTSGPVVTGSENTGGLIGYNNAAVTSGVATGDVKASSNYSGGLIGFNDKSGVVSGSKIAALLAALTPSVAIGETMARSAQASLKSARQWHRDGRRTGGYQYRHHWQCFLYQTNP